MYTYDMFRTALCPQAKRKTLSPNRLFIICSYNSINLSLILLMYKEKYNIFVKIVIEKKL